MRYAVVIERSESGFGACVPDLPGCVAVAETGAELRQLIREAIELHVGSLQEDGVPVPPPTAQVTYVEVARAA